MKEVLTISIASLVIMLLAPSAWATSSPASPDVSGYEIPLGELNKIKIERPLKKVKKEHKKKGTAAAQSPAEVVAAPEKKDSGTAIKTDIPQASKAHTPIYHDPYSYVITGKRTTVQAVISSADSIQSVLCRFRSTENGTSALVPMVLVPGTRFTYAATLPGLAATSRTLRYSIITVDSAGIDSRSQEFTTAAKSSGVLPDWQQDISSEKIKIRLENKEAPLEGFSDPGITE